MLSKILSSIRDKKGVSAAEYAILAVGVVIVVGGAVSAFRAPIQNAFTGIGTEIENQQSALTN